MSVTTIEPKTRATTEPTSKAPALRLAIIGPLGHHITVEVSSVEQLYKVSRLYGQRGWRPVTIPPGGLRRPLAEADIFDWSLIGARPGELDNSAGVWFDNRFYKRRDLEPNKKIPNKAVKYSRGAVQGDDPTAIERDGEFEYVTLISFRGNGRVEPAFCRPGARQES